MFKLLLLNFLIFFISEKVQGQDQKYCDPSLCTSSNGHIEPHIGCPGNAPNYCPPDAVEIEMTQDWINYIVHKHNTYRNDLAAGFVGDFPEAERMPLMQWDSELGYLAKLNMMRCIYGHDKCHNTEKYKWSGQNIAWTKNYPQDNYHIDSMIDAWWDEYQICPVSEIISFGKSEAKIGHFTVMAQDRSNRIGCAAVRFNGNERMLACNYGFTNLIGSYVYKIGPATSGCQTGSDDAYTSLCSINEVVDSNP